MAHHETAQAQNLTKRHRPQNGSSTKRHTAQNGPLYTNVFIYLLKCIILGLVTFCYSFDYRDIYIDIIWEVHCEHWQKVHESQ
jgi:hypothetical protein